MNNNYYDKYINPPLLPTGVKWVIFLIITAFLSLIFYSCHLDYSDERDYMGYTVTDKAVKNEGNSGIYLVYTVDKDGEVMVFSVEDRMLEGRYDSSDDYARIEVGKTYNFHTIGVRNHFWSSYPTIMTMEEVK